MNEKGKLEKLRELADSCPDVDLTEFRRTRNTWQFKFFRPRMDGRKRLHQEQAPVLFRAKNLDTALAWLQGFLAKNQDSYMSLGEALDKVLQLARPAFEGEKDTMSEEEEADYASALDVVEDSLTKHFGED